MKTSLRTALLGLVLALSVEAKTATGETRMNIVLITTDDEGTQLGCYGDPFADTPNIDELAEQGVLFKQAFVTHASCSPSRSSILTGLYPHQNGQIGLTDEHMEYRIKDGIPNLPALLKEAGYYNGILGKLHVKPVDAFPFDFKWAMGNPLATRDVREVARQAGLFLKQRDDRPFFLYVNYFDPHRPFDADMHQFKGIPEHPYQPDDIKPFPFLGIDSPVIREEVAAYYNGVKRADVGLGMLFDQLKEAGVYDNTLIIFVGDHGPPFVRAKTTAYEAGLGVPLVVRWPGVSQEKLQTEAFTSTVDLMPTILDAVGLESPPVAGRSLRGVVEGRTPPDWRKLLFAEYTSHANPHLYPRRTVRSKNYKLIHNLDAMRPNPLVFIGRTTITQDTVVDPNMEQAYKTLANPPEYELYHLATDPHETINLVDDPAYIEVLDTLKKALHAWREQTNDPLLDPAELRRLKTAHGLR